MNDNIKKNNSLIKKVFEKLQIKTEIKKRTENIKESKTPYSNNIVLTDKKENLLSIKNRIDTISKMRELYYSNPFAKNHARFYASKVFGEGFNVHSEHIELMSILKKSLKAIKNLKTLAEWLIIDGDIFIFIDSKENTNITTKYINSEEITDIIYEDDKPIKYIRTYYQEDYSLNEEIIDAKNILHISINKSPYSKFGVSDLFASYNWIKTHEEVVYAAARKVELENAFAWHVTMTNATKEDIKERASIYGTRSFKETLKKGGGIIVSNSKEEWNTLSRSASSNVDETALRETKLMAIAGSALPEFIITGDAKNANLSSAQAQDMPFSIIVNNYQEVWKDALKEYFLKIIDIEKKHYTISKYVNEKKTIDKSDILKYKLIYEILNIYEKEEDTVTIEYKIPVEEASYTIMFPDVLSSDNKQEVEVLKMEMDMGIVSKKTAAEKRGYNYKQEKLLNKDF